MEDLFLNGEWLPAVALGRVSVEDRGFQFGDGVYEVIRVYNGNPFRLSAHVDRLRRSLEGVEIPMPMNVADLLKVLHTVRGTRREATIYLQVTRGAAPRVHAFPRGIRPTFLAYAREIAPAPPDRTLSLHTVRDDRWGRCHLKTICLLPNILARQKAVEAGCDEGLFVREDGTVTEGTSSNAFFVRGGVVVTHPADARILNGITREVVLEIARQADVRVEERPLTIDEARRADEIFMTGTTTEVTPAVMLDGKPVGSGKPGPVTGKLRAAFRERVKRECG